MQTNVTALARTALSRTAEKTWLVSGGLAAATALWTVIAFRAFTGTLLVAHVKSVTLAYPAGLLVLSLYVRANRRALLLAAGWGILVCAAFLIAPVATKSPIAAEAVFATLVATFACARFPAGAVVTLVLLTATLGSTLALTGVQLGRGGDLILAGSWLGVLGRSISSSRHPQRRLWPAIALCISYVAITFAEIFTAATPSIGLFSFRTSTWYIMAVFLVAYAAWPEATYRRIARGLIVVTALVAGYAVLRWQIGPSAEEALNARTASGGINLVNGDLRTVGSFATGHELALWTGFMAPFALAFAIASAGWWRFWGFLATMLSALALIASQARGPLVGMVVGMLVAVGLFGFARAFALRRMRLVFGAALASLLLAAAGVAFLGPGSGSSGRYARILNPTTDIAYQDRKGKWTGALDQLHGHPFGLGLGTAGFVKTKTDPRPTIADSNLDSSYIKIAYEQGIPVMVLFTVGWLLLGGRLAMEALITRRRDLAGLAIGGVGALVSILISFYTGIYVESITVLGGWIVVGLGLAQLVTRPVQAGEPQTELGRA